MSVRPINFNDSGQGQRSNEGQGARVEAFFSIISVGIQTPLLLPPSLLPPLQHSQEDIATISGPRQAVNTFATLRPPQNLATATIGRTKADERIAEIGGA